MRPSVPAVYSRLSIGREEVDNRHETDLDRATNSEAFILKGKAEAIMVMDRLTDPLPNCYSAGFAA